MFDLFMEYFKTKLNQQLVGLLDAGSSLSDLKKQYGKVNIDDTLQELRFHLAVTCGWKSLTLLSQRAKECLVLLAKGFTYQEIANFLKLSGRTVEHYLESVKNKLGKHTRSELIPLAEKLTKFGLAS